MIEGACHCGAVRFSCTVRPQQLVDCNCSVCRRYRALWAHVPLEAATIRGETIAYAHGDRTLAFHSCAICGGTTHWLPLKPQRGKPWMALNMAMAAPDAIAGLPLRRFDGAESWRFLD